MAKRILDVVCSFWAILLLSPFMIVITILLLITTNWRPFFLQERSGLLGKPFYIFKFRTMKDPVGTVWEPEKDMERLTSLGRILRDYSLDELPQLWNVLFGQMSLVGPRPLPIEYFPLYSEIEKRRFNVKPGITGWAQVNGRNQISWEERFRLDTWYVENQSLRLDIIILLRSVSNLLSKKGINKSRNLSMPKFTGSKI